MHVYCMHVRRYACMHACMHVCMHACMHVCLYAARPELAKAAVRLNWLKVTLMIPVAATQAAEIDHKIIA